MLKNIKWLGSSRETIQGFIKVIRAEAGYQLYRVQQGLMPTDYKPMTSIGPGVWEIRLHKPHEHRILYVSKIKDQIYVLHAFEKKTQKTALRNIKIAKKNYQALMNRLNTLKIKE